MANDQTANGPPSARTQRQVKAAYLRAEIGLSDPVPELMFDHDMMHSEALKYLGL